MRTNRVEAELLTDLPTRPPPPQSLVEMGARVAVVTRGADGAVARGAATADVAGPCAPAS